ncbi:MAG: hypothetical protein JSV10_10875 [Candidatus Zixiibacteriota bacterium]|nr:MAG: hypothetical protein JSV10_10875 [candidate division Zixibacteria bacterium]
MINRSSFLGLAFPLKNRKRAMVCLGLAALLSIPAASLSFAIDLDFSDSDSWEISASTQVEFSSDRKTHQDIFHSWTDLDLTYGMYGVNLRYDAHQPDDWGVSWQKLAFRNFHLTSEFLEITAGNYYVLLGRGLILRSYENRDLRYDNNIDGVKGTVEFEGFNLTLLGGTATGKYDRLSDPLHAADGKVAVTDWLTAGGSYLRTHVTDFGLVRFHGANASLNLPNVDFYAEYAKKYNPSQPFEPDEGEGIYLAGNVFTAGLGLTLELKHYEDFLFLNPNLPPPNEGVTLNNPPPLAREHMYTLLNRHAYVLEFDERGIQAELTSSPFEGLSVLANYSRTTDHEDELIFSEAYGEFEYDYSDRATIKGGFSRQKSKQEEGDPVRMAPVVDLIYYLSDSDNINFILEHLYTDKFDDKLTYYDQILSLSFSRSPTGSITLTHERTTEWEVREAWSGRRDWLIATLDLTLGENHNVSLSVGSRRKGKVCAGGVCVDKPALNGFEIKLLSRF